MADDAFHLTPLDIRRFDFGNALRGYDRARVDQFREQVANEVERLLRNAQGLEAKAQGFHEQLRAFRERDKAINEALISAQQLRAEVKEQAEREAQLILREAKAEGDRIVAAAHNESRRIEADLDGLVKQRRAYLLQLRSLVERQLAEIEAAEASPGPAVRAPAVAEPATIPAATPLWLDSVVKD
ncbi:MAG: DivIVA domain-containing protein [Gemmatimonadaceae bacterium]|nr:DivIVA domain-containing protein [Gemmatimonadaceae bacterium]